MMALLTLNPSKSQEISSLPTEPTLREAATLLTYLVRDAAFLDTRVHPLLQEARERKGWYVAHRHEGPDGPCSLQVFVWPPGSRTKIHDHSSWGAFCCAVGWVLEERYERLDDGSLPDHARLRKAWRRVWRGEDGVSTVLPYEGGIHWVGNPGTSTAISVHLYGPQIGEVDGRNYDPSQNYVCDRMDV